MFQVVYEYPETWPENGALLVETRPLSIEIPVSPTQARRRANGYLGMHVAMSILAGEPILVFGERPIWRMTADLYLPAIGFVGTVGKIEIDALTGTPFPLPSEEITNMQDRADEFATRLTPSAELPL
jgi:hypothetical protein